MRKILEVWLRGIQKEGERKLKTEGVTEKDRHAQRRERDRERGDSCSNANKTDHVEQCQKKK